MKFVNLFFSTFVFFAWASLAHSQSLDLSCDLYLSGTPIVAVDPILMTNKFKVDRSLTVYGLHFPFAQTGNLEVVALRLPAESVWMDMGAGKAVALVEGLKRNINIREGIAVSYAKPSNAFTEKDLPGRFRYLDGDYVENMARNKQFDDVAGKVDLITDVYGPLSYAQDITPVMQVYLNLLKVDGTLVFNLMNARNHINSKQLTDHQVVQMNSEIEIRKWLTTIPGIQIVEETNFRTPGSGAFENSLGFKIQKLSHGIKVPEIKTLEYEPGSPPNRKFGFNPIIH